MLIKKSLIPFKFIIYQTIQHAYPINLLISYKLQVHMYNKNTKYKYACVMECKI